MKIHQAVRLNDEVYLPENDQHAELLAGRLDDRQKDRLREAGAISGPGSETENDKPTVKGKKGKKKLAGSVETKEPSLSKEKEDTAKGGKGTPWDKKESDG